MYNGGVHFRSMNPNEHVSRMGLAALGMLNTIVAPVDERNRTISAIGQITEPNYFPSMIKNQVLDVVNSDAVMYVLFLCFIHSKTFSMFVFVF